MNMPKHKVYTEAVKMARQWGTKHANIKIMSIINKNRCIDYKK